MLRLSGNGKIDSTPHPLGLRRIKRVSLKVFVGLKELVGNKVHASIPPRGYRKKSRISRKEPEVIDRYNDAEYEPSNIDTAYDSLRWRWRRVTQWDRYINDTIENIKGHMIT